MMAALILAEHEDLVRDIGRRAYIYRWSADEYRARRQHLAHLYSASIEEIQLLCGEGWREAIAEEQDDGLPLLYLRELREQLDESFDDRLVWLCDQVIENLEIQEE